mmetsp:Transcript_9899/g.35960  ORF Transcript_9899/g.35960 Transcript_9899/m.35960 type:complete len:297 (-) Transcript_9899:618-1508(-)
MVRETCAASVSVATASCVARRGSTRASVSAARVLAFLSPPRSPPEVSAASFPRKTFTCAPAASAGGGGVPVRAMTSGAMTSGASTSAAFIDASSAAWLTRDRLSDFDNPPAPVGVPLAAIAAASFSSLTAISSSCSRRSTRSKSSFPRSLAHSSSMLNTDAASERSTGSAPRLSNARRLSRSSAAAARTRINVAPVSTALTVNEPRDAALSPVFTSSFASSFAFAFAFAPEERRGIRESKAARPSPSRTREVTANASSGSAFSPSSSSSSLTISSVASPSRPWRRYVTTIVPALAP